MLMGVARPNTLLKQTYIRYGRSLLEHLPSPPNLLLLLIEKVGACFDWLVGCFGFNGPLRQYFSLYRAVSQREGERRERIDESKNVQTTPTAPTASAVGPCPTVTQIVGRPGTGSLPTPMLVLKDIHSH